MKYMRWSDLEPGDVLRFIDYDFENRPDLFNERFKGEDLIIKYINFGPSIRISFLGRDSVWFINYDGTSYPSDFMKPRFKLIRLKDEKRWSDLERGDVLQFTDEWLDYHSSALYDFKNKDLIIKKVEFRPFIIKIYFHDRPYHVINYDGMDRRGIVVFKLIKLKDI